MGKSVREREGATARREKDQRLAKREGMRGLFRADEWEREGADSVQVRVKVRAKI